MWMKMLMINRLLLPVILVLFFISCSSAPRYGSADYPSQKTKSRQIPVEKNPKLSYQRNWTGISSWYGKDFHGKKTANGEIFDMYGLSAAHKTLPLGTTIRVTNLSNRKSVVVVVNDRGPYVAGRLIDLSYGAAKKLGFENQGTAKVKIQVIAFGDNKYKK